MTLANISACFIKEDLRRVNMSTVGGRGQSQMESKISKNKGGKDKSWK